METRQKWKIPGKPVISAEFEYFHGWKKHIHDIMAQ